MTSRGLRTFSYRIYGLSLVSEISFPEVSQVALRTGETPDARITVGDLGSVSEPYEWFFEPPLPNGEPWLRCAKLGSDYLLRYTGFADFVVSYDRREIRFVGTVDEAEEVTVRHLLLDGVLPLFLNLVGREALHATAVAVGAGVCAFTGQSGSGKSTLAASFVKAGYELVCDDCLALENRDRVVAIPGYLGLRLRLDALEALGGESAILMPVAGYTSKSRYLGAPGVKHFRDDPMPLVRIYSLRRIDENTPRIETLRGSEALMEIVEETFRLDVTDKSMLKRQFRFLAGVIARVPVKSLYLPNDLDALPAVREAVLRDLAEQP